MKDIEIEKIIPANTDDRGWVLNLDSKDHNNLLALSRKKGKIFGEHYHKGLSVTKNPEIFVILKGKVELEYFNINNQDKKNKIIITELNKVKIHPFIFHKFKTLEDTVFIELQHELYNMDDTFRL